MNGYDAGDPPGMCTMPPPNDKPEPTRAKRAPRTLGLKVQEWQNCDLPGPWHVSLKVDGVCVIVREGGKIISRAGKPLYNVPELRLGIYECYLGSWEKSVSAVRSQFSADGKHPAAVIPADAFYRLADLDGHPAIDARLKLPEMQNPSRADIRAALQRATHGGYEGIVLRAHCGATWRLFKVKPKQTYDVPVTGLVMGKGKHAGRMGALITPMGNVGTGFSDAQRVELSAPPFVKCAQAGDVLIEVEAMGLTPAGKFRHPRFVRVRWDK
jgi:hypothetical protein